MTRMLLIFSAKIRGIYVICIPIGAEDKTFILALQMCTPAGTRSLIITNFFICGTIRRRNLSPFGLLGK
jgi:hypothetical protein